jgi:hypothetical protein
VGFAKLILNNTVENFEELEEDLLKMDKNNIGII